MHLPALIQTLTLECSLQATGLSSEGRANQVTMPALNKAQKQQVANLVRQRRLGLISMEDFTSFSEAVMGGTASQPEAVDELLLDSVITQEVIATTTCAAFHPFMSFLSSGVYPIRLV